MQPELDFGGLDRNCDAIAQWRKRREEEQLALARTLGLPLGKKVEVWLRGGVRLRGWLKLHEETLIREAEGARLRFTVGETPFSVDELESCSRLETTDSPE